MEQKTVNSYYFSPSGTTKKIASILTGALSDSVEETDLLTQPLTETREIPKDEILIVSVPVFAGRIPEIAAEQLQRLKGNQGPAIAVVVYGNRAYDDALIELRDRLDQNGFLVCAGAAFVAQHSIFPGVATGRPDAEDAETILAFAKEIKGMVAQDLSQRMKQSIEVAGNRPYRNGGVIPLHPKADRSCVQCGACSKICPKGAIDSKKPRKCNGKVCISCTACIAVCPNHCRSFSGFLWSKVHNKFKQDCCDRKEPEFFWPDWVGSGAFE